MWSDQCEVVSSILKLNAHRCGCISYQVHVMVRILGSYVTFWNSDGDLDNLEIRLFQACSKTVIIRADKSHLVKLGALRRQFDIEHFPLIVQCT